MANAASLLAFTVVFAIGFVTGKLFAATQFAFMKSSSNAAKDSNQAKKNVDTLIELGKKL